MKPIRKESSISSKLDKRFKQEVAGMKLKLIDMLDFYCLVKDKNSMYVELCEEWVAELKIFCNNTHFLEDRKEE